MKTGRLYTMLLVLLCSLLVLVQCKPKPVQAPAESILQDSIDEDETVDIKVDTSKKSLTFEVGYFETFETLPQLKFTPVTETEFKRFRNKTYLTKPQVRETKDHFYLLTSKEEHCFLKYKDYGNQLSWHGQELMGYYPDLKLYAVSEMSTSEGLGFGQLFLLDSINNCKYSIISLGDGSVELPVPSKNNKYMVYYYNYLYEQKHALLAVLKVNDKQDPANYLKEVASFDSQNFAVESIVWISDHSFLVKGYQEVYRNESWEKDYSYYQCHF